MDPILFILTIIAAVVAGAAVLLPSETRRPIAWDEDDLQHQLEASPR